MSELTTPEEVEGTYAQYLLHHSKTTDRSFDTRVVAALDADELARQAVRRVNAYLEAVEGDETPQLLADGAIDCPGVAGSSAGLFLDDVRVLAAVLRHRGLYVW